MKVIAALIILSLLPASALAVDCGRTAKITLDGLAVADSALRGTTLVSTRLHREDRGGEMFTIETFKYTKASRSVEISVSAEDGCHLQSIKINQNQFE